MKKNDPVVIYKKLIHAMPSIGFLNRQKRIRAYLKVTSMTQTMIDAEEINEDEALFILSLLVKKSHSFRKAGMMTALSLESIPVTAIKAIGIRYANEMRNNLSLPSIKSGFDEKSMLE